MVFDVVVPVAPSARIHAGRPVELVVASQY